MPNTRQIIKNSKLLPRIKTLIQILEDPRTSLFKKLKARYEFFWYADYIFQKRYGQKTPKLKNIVAAYHNILRNNIPRATIRRSNIPKTVLGIGPRTVLVVHP